MRLLVALAVAVLAWVGNAWGDTIQIQYTTLDYPGSLNTQLNGIDGNNIVGNGSSLPGGFLYNGSTFTQITYPLAVASEPMAISGGTIVGNEGNYSTGSNYIYNGSTYTIFTTPFDAYGSTVFGISGDRIVGGYWDEPWNAGGECHGFYFDGSTFTSLTDPLAGSNHKYTIQGTAAYGISGNSIVGDYIDANDVYHGFIYNIETQAFTTLDDPSAAGSFGTVATGISGNNIVGIYYVSLGGDESAMHGFLYDGSAWTTIDDPNAVGATYVTGISGNTIVGYYWNANDNNEGFIATIVPEPSILALLGGGGLCLVGHGLRRRWKKRRSAAAEDAVASDEGPATLSFLSRSFEAKRRAAQPPTKTVSDSMVEAYYRAPWAILNCCNVIPVTPFRLVMPPRAANAL